jgi:hypothetical protein
MTHDPARLKLANERLTELLKIEPRKDLTDAQKEELIGAKMEEYRQHPYQAVPVNQEESQQPAITPPKKRTLEEQIEHCRKVFEKGIQEGRIHITGYPE